MAIDDVNKDVLRCVLSSDLKRDWRDWTIAVGGSIAAQGVLFFLRDGGLVASAPHLPRTRHTHTHEEVVGYVGANTALPAPHVSVTRTRNTKYRDQPVDLWRSCKTLLAPQVEQQPLLTASSVCVRVCETFSSVLLLPANLQHPPTPPPPHPRPERRQWLSEGQVIWLQTLKLFLNFACRVCHGPECA